MSNYNMPIKYTKSYYYRKLERLFPNVTRPKWIGSYKKDMEELFLTELNKQLKKNVESFNVMVNVTRDKLIGSKIKDLINGRTKRIFIKYPSTEELKYALNELLTANRKILMRIGNVYYTLNIKNITKLLNFIDELYVTGSTEHMGSDGEIMQEIQDMRKVTFSIIEKNRNYIEGSKFNYIHNLPISLKRYQIASSNEETLTYDFSMNCFVYALKMAGVDEKIINDMALSIKGSQLPRKYIKELCDKHNLYVIVKTLGKDKHLFHYGNKEMTPINIGLIDKHYFLIERTKITLEELRGMFKGKIYHNKSHEMTSYNVIKFMYNNKEKYLTSTLGLTKKELNNVHEVLAQSNNINYEEHNIQLNQFKEKKEDDYVNIFFDSETTTEGKHITYLMRCADIDIDFMGEDAGLKMLRYLSNKYEKIRLIAHNASYDFKFIYKYLDRIQLIERGKRLLHGNAIFWVCKNKLMNVQIQDSYALIPMKLSKFSSCFGLESEKEFMPYSLYTQKNIAKRFIDVEEFKQYESYNKFMENCNKWACINDNKVDIIKYSSKYCAMDCQVLKEGYNVFRTNIKSIAELDINNYVSVASIANAYMEKQGVYEGVYQLNGIVREFIQKCVVGGRTMSRNNEKYHITKTLDDFDAVSLYPSAMSRLGGFPKGKPKVIEDTTYEFLKSCDSYFVEILVLEVGKKYNFPLISVMDEDKGVRNFTNYVAGRKIYVDKITLEDLIQFHNIKFEVIRGYFYNEGRNNKLKETIDYLFNERIKAKAEKNPIQEVYKLLMNSAYGKTLLKPYETETKYIKNSESEAYISKHYEHIQTFTKLSDDKTTQIKEYVNIDEHYNNVSCGVEVLAMSKRIMNEVMTLAEDLDYEIYYQDTDSMHIESDKVKLLAEEFKNKYGRELIGEAMGQFHCDFSSEKIRKNIKSVESYFLGKKCYIDKLEGQDEKGNTMNDYHIRMKGVSNSSILYYAEQNNITPFEIYKNLYNGDEIEFDLTCGGNTKIFDYTKYYDVETMIKFSRRIKF